MNDHQRANDGGSKSSRKKRRRKNRQNQAKQVTQFWGASSDLPAPAETVRITREPAAVIRSIGRPPLTGHEVIAEHYFAAVYDRAVSLSSALAAAADLVDPDDL